jgi:hypothetical protein
MAGQPEKGLDFTRQMNYVDRQRITGCYQTHTVAGIPFMTAVIESSPKTGADHVMTAKRIRLRREAYLSHLRGLDKRF